MAQPTRSMRAWQYTNVAHGLEQALYLNRSAALPTEKRPLGPKEVLVRVHYAALNAVDYKLPELPIAGRLVISKPATPGLDYAGRIVECGSEVQLEIGQAVYGKLEPKQPCGTLADYVIGSYEGTVPIPDGIEMEDAVGAGVCGLVTYQCLARHIKRGDNVLINGGSGGTGTFAIQIAKAMGANVTTTCSRSNLELCRSLGADRVVDYEAENLILTLKKSGEQYDMILDNVGHPPELYWECPHFTKLEAPYVQIGTQVSLPFVYDLAFRLFLPTWLGGGKRKFLFGFTSTNRQDYEELTRLMSAGKVKSVVEQVFDFEDVPAAYARMKTGRARGKIVIRVAENKECC
ncbi:uncharacterized protein PV09_03629 [Verruconis gallopava]|uniref:Enoyl reductase (ER) domain-containing protein n=1 Tax=Verruconis gallopava TaxID=253628 RepID=A0A0D2AFM1_9PEZI|nr:uncharacterized protein PV09_03629 [Verruconis gallopava]KIW05773.1 hypothetical protein PV09_03629 [Verruconis gallopava]